MNILVSGAGGLIGSAFVERVRARGWRAVPLRRTMSNEREPGPTWNVKTGQIDLAPETSFDAVVHLAGESVGQRWTESVRRRIRESRVNGTKNLGIALKKLPKTPGVVICASAIGFYGDAGSNWVDESAASGQGFLASVCREWEQSAREAFGQSRLVSLRIGVVLSKNGGALPRMLPAFRFGVAGRLGAGSQYWSWITLDDLLHAIEFALEHEAVVGPINAVSPNPVTNLEFTRTLGRVLHRPTIFPVPAFAVKLLFGEMGREALLAGARVRPRRLEEAGFAFADSELEPALRRILAAP